MKAMCYDTHGLLTLGTCPWCHQAISEGQVKPDLPARLVAIRQWNIPAMLKALADEDVEVRSAVVSNIIHHGPKPELALPLLRQALKDSQRRVRWLTISTLQMMGMHLLYEEAERFEEDCLQHPDDCALHMLLLCYYSFASARSEDARRAYHRHGLWAIENAAKTIAEGNLPWSLDPAKDGEVYEQAKRLWLKHVEADGDNVIILGGAANFFTLHDKEVSETFLKKAQSLEPNNPEWSERLGHLYALELHNRDREPRPEAASLSFAELERAFACETVEFKRFWMLRDLARAAFRAGEWDKARSYATDMLNQSEKPDFFYHKNGEAIFHGNLVLGLLCLRSGDVENAKQHLVASAKSAGSPVLCSSGPDVTLAKELLDRGESAVVVEFLKLCTNFWKTNDHRTEQWIYAIEHGQKPDFRFNLSL